VGADRAAIEQALAPYWDEHARSRTDGVARAPMHTTLERKSDGLAVVVTLLDDEETEWTAAFFVAFAHSRREIALELVRVGPA